jgi:hypothetical protein
MKYQGLMGQKKESRFMYTIAYASAPILAIRKLKVNIRDDGCKAIARKILPALFPFSKMR